MCAAVAPNIDESKLEKWPKEYDNGKRIYTRINATGYNQAK